MLARGGVVPATSHIDNIPWALLARGRAAG
jgi:hypothetical protein